MATAGMGLRGIKAAEAALGDDYCSEVDLHDYWWVTGKRHRNPSPNE
jgi:hypothetical protein